MVMALTCKAVLDGIEQRSWKQIKQLQQKQNIYKPCSKEDRARNIL